jgi:SAM-dependent methyltransferase
LFKSASCIEEKQQLTGWFLTDGKRILHADTSAPDLSSAMDIAAYYDIAYTDHTIMNPITEEALLGIVRRFVRPAEPALLDIGSGKGYPALTLAREFGARCTLLDSRPRWNDMARTLFSEHGLERLLVRQETQASALNFKNAQWDIIMCLGTTPVFGNFRAALRILGPALKNDGFFIIGEPCIDVPLPRSYKAWINRQGWDILDMRKLLRILDVLRLELRCCRRSTPEEWDEYMNLQWNSIIEHAASHPEDPTAREYLSRAREERNIYLRYQRHYMEWNALIVSRRGS